MSENVFTYGTLMHPRIWGCVVRGTYASTRAVLPHHERRVVREVDYPGMIACRGTTVAGILYHDVSPEDIRRLNAFEGQEYERVTVEVQLPDSTALKAQTYIYHHAHHEFRHRLGTELWEYETFLENGGVERFLQQYGGFLALDDRDEDKS